DDIATEMGISKKTIYAHFGNKTELVHDTTSFLFDHITRGIEAICVLEKDPIEELYEIKKLVMLNLKDERSSPQYQLQKYYPQVHGQFKKKHFQTMFNCTKKNLQRGVAQGLYRDDIDMEFIPRMHFLGVNGTKDEALFPPAIFPKVVLVEQALEYHLRSIVTPKGLDTLKKFIKTNQETHA
ncbi:MAG: TetR/AcrR family transcriptional regulator, partial [Marinirhabdus sp.]